VRCINCLAAGAWLCRDCRDYVTPPPLICIICREPSARGLTCDNCREETALTGVVSAGEYSSEYMRRAVQWLKFKGVRALAPLLASLLAPRLTAIAPLPLLAEQAVLIPLPLHLRRERERGFNQSREIARELSRLTAIPLADILVRTRSTWSQAKLPLALRSGNTAQAFAVASATNLHGRTAIIIDDVVTSGATLSAAAEALLETNPRAIWAATIARG
jgi:ComF family protein